MVTATIPTPSIPIAELQPGLDPEVTSVTGIVTLIWPYASSIQSISLLLVEPDFRLRRHRGQVRIHFNGASAKAVVRSGVSSGDRLSLGLKGSEWAKDGSAATTPGKGIEWELRYGERVVLQVQRQYQEPVILDIDHPPPSPQSVTNASSPRRSPSSNSHIAISTQRPLPNTLIWESPAFLKRSQLTSSYDPFASEEEEDFPNNERRKRSKFGRGSGQWRFADRTPSPEKEPDLDEFKGGSPSKPQYKDRAVYKTAGPQLQRSQKYEDHAGSDGKEQGLRELTEEADGKTKTNGAFNEVGQQIHVITDDLDHNAASNAPPSPPSTTIELSEAEASRETTPTVEVVPSSPQPIYSVSASESDQESESDAEEESEPDRSDGAAFGGSASDFGLDGSVFSRTQQPPEERPHIEPAIEEPERLEVDDAVKRSLKKEASSPSVSDSEQERQRLEEGPNTIKESVHGYQILDGGDSNQTLEHEVVEQNTEDSLGVSPPPSDQLREQQTLEMPSPDAVRMLVSAVLQRLQSNETTVETNERGTSVEEPLGMELELAEPHDINKEETDLTPQLSKARVSKVEIIDLESDDEAEDVAQATSQQSTHSPPVDMGVPIAENLTHQSKFSTATGLATLDEPPPLPSCTPSPTVAGRIRNAFPQQNLNTEMPVAQDKPHSPGTPGPSPSIAQNVRDDALQSDLGAEKPFLQEKPADSTSQKQLSEIEAQDTGPRYVGDTRNDRSGPGIGAKQRLQPDESTEPKSKGEAILVAEQAFSSQLTKLEVPPKLKPRENEREAESQDSFVELPAIVQDSVRGQSSRSQLLTPDTTQRTSFASQPSFSSLQSPSDDDTLPTPHRTQGKSANPVVPIAPQLACEPSTARSPPVLENHELPAEKRRSPEKTSLPQRPPTLIEKLKAMKRLSSQAPHKVGDASAISPWFAPKRSSIIVPESEAESGIESLSEGDRKSIKQDVTAKLQTLEKQELLANSFIRSPPQPEGIHSIASSPGYLPPSQPPPPGFRTSLSYFVPLATLQSQFTLAVDILAIVLSATPVTRAILGARDYNQTIYITDPSSSLLRSPVITAQIFRSHNKCFPMVEEGDALLLRDFKVQSFQRQLSLLSTQSSAWAVFRRDADVQIPGPPVEFGAEERGFARGLWRWWTGLDHEVKDRLFNGVPKDKKGKAIPLDKKPNERVPSKEKRLDDNKDKSDVKIKKEGIAGLGVYLPGSKEKTRRLFKREKSLELEVDLPSSQGRTRKPSLKERSLGLDGVLESTEPPKRVLRPRGARGVAERSESPMKAMNRRSGTVFTGGLGEPASD